MNWQNRAGARSVSSGVAQVSPVACCVVDCATARIDSLTPPFARAVGYMSSQLAGASMQDLSLLREPAFLDLSVAEISEPRDVVLCASSGAHLRAQVLRLMTVDGAPGKLLFGITGPLRSGSRPVTLRQRAPSGAWVDAEPELREAVLEGASSQQLAELTVRRLREVLACDRVCLIRFRFDRQLACVEAVSTAYASRIVAGASFPIAAGTRRVRGRPRVIGNGLRSSDPIVQRLAAEGYVSFLNVPLVVRGELIGALNAASREDWDWAPWQREQARLAGSCVAICLSTAQLVEDARASARQLEQLSQRLLHLQDSERQHIGRELHDDLGQLLSGLVLSLPDAAALPPPADAMVGRAHALAREAIDSVRTLTVRLRQPVFDGARLRAVLAQLVDEYTARTGVHVTLWAPAEMEDLPLSTEVKTCIYRVVQEALTNVARHARVAAATVKLSVDTQGLHVRVVDRGAGFVPGQTTGGLGLLGMTERARLAEACVDVTSTPGKGTTVHLEVPVGTSRP